MRRANTAKPTAILTSDMHLRDTQPVCRLDDFWTTQWKKVEFIRQLRHRYECPILHAGDLFHHWKCSPKLVNAALQDLPDYFYTVYGQHDLPQHNLDLVADSSVYTLVLGERVLVLPEAHYGQTPSSGSISLSGRKILVWHNLTWCQELPYPGCTASPASKLLDRYPQFDLILTGDNHRSFYVADDGRLLVNPGSLTRQTADQVDHEPCVYLWYAETNTVEQVFIPIDSNVVSRSHIEHDKERDQRIDAFVSKLSDDWKVAVDFATNLDRFFRENPTRQSVVEIIRAAIES